MHISQDVRLNQRPVICTSRLWLLLRALGIELLEPKGWTCCGATAGHQTDRLLAASLPAASLLKVKDMGLEMVVNCAACYNRMKVANHEISTNPEIRKGVFDAIGRDYDGSVKVRHFMEVLWKMLGLMRLIMLSSARSTA